MTVEQNIGIGFTGNKEDKQKMVEQLIHHFQLDGLEKLYPSKAFRRTAAENGTSTDYGI